MSWRYVQSTGELSHNGRRRATGYSGYGTGKNNPADEAVHEFGPIPRGHYRLGHPHASSNTGPFVMDLTPVGHDALGRRFLEIHGDSRTHPGRASGGCIVVSPLEIRHRIWDSGDHDLDVVR